MSGISSNNQLLAVIASSRRRGPGSITVADEAERYALTGIEPGQLVFQEDDEVTYQLNAPSEDQGGVFVSGGTADGIYAINGEAFGRGLFDMLGGGPGDDSVFWNGVQWSIATAVDGIIYYSLSDVSTPDLASDWKNASDDTPAGITVTSITQGELDAGIFAERAGFDSGVYISQGNQNGFSIYVDSLGGFAASVGPAGLWNISALDDGAFLSDSLTAFPWQADNYIPDDGTPPAPTVTRNDIAAPANWAPV